MGELRTFSGRRASQVEGELTAFISLLRERSVHRYLEIGARDGDTFHAVMSALPVGARGVAVDFPGGLWGSSKSRSNLVRAAHDLRSRGYEVSVLFADSRLRETHADVRSHGPFDAVFIDGDHTYRGVQADWKNFGGMAPLIAFHDIAGHGMSTRRGRFPVEVPRLWAQLKLQEKTTKQFTTLEFIDADSRMGIGVVLR